jgi:protein-S-isoprenylcysteine O-methyltransferase Ste14
MAGIALFLLPELAYRMNVEEKLLAEHFGEEYINYVRRSKRLIPGIW